MMPPDSRREPAACRPPSYGMSLHNESVRPFGTASARRAVCISTRQMLMPLLTKRNCLDPRRHTPAAVMQLPSSVSRCRRRLSMPPLFFSRRLAIKTQLGRRNLERFSPGEADVKLLFCQSPANALLGPQPNVPGAQHRIYCAAVSGCTLPRAMKPVVA